MDNSRIQIIQDLIEALTAWRTAATSYGPNSLEALRVGGRAMILLFRNITVPRECAGRLGANPVTTSILGDPALALEQLSDSELQDRGTWAYYLNICKDEFIWDLKQWREALDKIAKETNGAGQADGTPAADMFTKRFRIALSFPGEHRSFVEQIASHLADQVGWQRVLYDKYHEAELARADLDTYLQRLYHDQSELIVVFLCADYERKEWCGLEWRAIRDLIKGPRKSDVMFLRFDDTTMPGLFSIDGYVAIENRSPQEVGDLILQRLDK
jgi:hypothetical protein